MDIETRALIRATHRESGRSAMIPAEDTPEFPHADYDVPSEESPKTMKTDNPDDGSAEPKRGRARRDSEG